MTMRTTIRTLKMTILAGLFALPALAAPGAPMAEAPHAGKFWRRPRVQRELGLTTEQVRDLDEVFARNQKTLVDLKADLEKKQLDRETLMADPRADEKKLEAQVDRVADARARLEKARATMFLEFRKILTPDQREKMQEFRERRQERREERRMERRNGGFGGQHAGGGRNFR